MKTEKHCESCSCEKEREFNGLICQPIEQIGVAFEKIKIPEGWRIPVLQEAMDLVNNSEFVEWSKFNDEKHDFFIKQPFQRNNNRLTWLGCYDGSFSINADYYLSSNSAARGVLLVKEAKQK